jgi:hypothetical protein
MIHRFPSSGGCSLIKGIARGLAEKGLASEVIATHERTPNGRCASCRRKWPCPMRLRGEEARVLQRRAQARAASRRTRSAPPRVPPLLRSAAE